MTGDQMFKKFENARWQMAAILKIEKLRSITVWPILMKFCTMTHISSPELTGCSKIQDGRRAPFRIMLNAISQQP